MAIMGYTVVDLFAGAGGFSRGFLDAGFDVALGIEIDGNAARTYSYNFPNAVMLLNDIRNVNGEDIIKYIGSRPDVIIGGSPCEAFTETNPRRAKDPLDRLYVDELGRLTLEFIRLVGELRPRVFVLENVVRIMDGPLRDALVNEFARVGYERIYFNVLHAEDYGTPSIRRRVFISNIPIKPRKTGRVLTVWDAIGDLPSPGDPSIPNHEYVTISDRKLRGITQLNWDEALYKFRGATGFFRNFIRLNPWKPAPTVMGSVRFVHPIEDRVLTVREQARLMGFPDNHVFLGPKDSQFNQIGEAVPPPLARAIASFVLKYLNGNAPYEANQITF
ncbi:restriction endonuclease subunit M [Vulcanisaeta souniana JCM 11219]|uniref:DNA (cytosine-5-)-methyltransferase n=2 Tax=Vulcanisaeta souniana TaxID=164452 RepID=A0A830E4S1_9CREN|nr:restriction endonuclease subunit M [Vulcanisaeta souniana JCM 11219]GGI82162.1 restriction endonuclease subunit M [Vulcanisaeta souniana JCM 11219]